LRIAPLAVLVAAWALFVVYSWPGLMSADSVSQLSQARQGIYGDWHPPLMSALWRRLDAVVSGPPLMLVLQTGLFALGLFAVFRRYTTAGRAAVIATAVFLFPPVFAPMSTIWKDSLMAAVALCAAAGLASRSRAAQLAAWLAFVTVAALRHNGPILVVPITAMLVPYATRWPTWRRRALGAALGVVAGLAGMLASRALTDFDEYPFANMIAMPDTAAIIALSGPMPDPEVRSMLDGTGLIADRDIQARLRAAGAADGDVLALIVGDHAVYNLATTAPTAAALVRAWRAAVIAHPGIYLRHRLQLMTHVLGWSRTRPLACFSPVNQDTALLATVGEVQSYSAYQRAIAAGLWRIRRSFVFWSCSASDCS